MIELILGDCLDMMSSIKDKSIDLVLADMPYGTTQCKWDQVINLELLWKQIDRVAKDNAAILLFAQSPFDKVLGASNISKFRYEWIWEKNISTGYLNAKRMPMKSHENILVFYKKIPTYNPLMTKGERKVVNSRGVASPIYGDHKSTSYDSCDRYPRSVIKFNNDSHIKKYHPTGKPVKLLEYMIKTYSNEGDLVLDFCMGSGSTGVACNNVQRSFIGIEKDIDYFNISRSRIFGEACFTK